MSRPDPSLASLALVLDLEERSTYLLPPPRSRRRCGSLLDLLRTVGGILRRESSLRAFKLVVAAIEAVEAVEAVVIAIEALVIAIEALEAIIEAGDLLGTLLVGDVARLAELQRPNTLVVVVALYRDVEISFYRATI